MPTSTIRAKRTRSTSPSGRAGPVAPTSQPGTVPGVAAGPAGTSSARPSVYATWASRWASTAAGADLIFPHHECEIVQSERANGVRPFARLWSHVAMVRKDGAKMSKSLGNMVFVRELLERYSPDAIRIALLAHHYREVWEWAPAEMDAAASLAERLTRGRRRARPRGRRLRPGACGAGRRPGYATRRRGARRSERGPTPRAGGGARPAAQRSLTAPSSSSRVCALASRRAWMPNGTVAMWCPWPSGRL